MLKCIYWYRIMKVHFYLKISSGTKLY
jgi:hypothetical protein